MKSSSTKDVLGIGIITYRRWIEYHFTPKMNRKIIGIDHVRPISLFDKSDIGELRMILIEKNTQLILRRVHQISGLRWMN